LRPVTAKVQDTSAQKKAQQQQKGGFGGGRGGRGGGKGGRGGGGRAGASMLDQEKPGSTTIIELIPQGIRVKAGDVICKFDSSALLDEEQAQHVRWLQAKSYVEQANALLAVSLITQKEYRDGIYPLDLQLIRQYIQTCELDFERLRKTAAWSYDMLKQGYRTHFQANADRLALEQADIALKDARNMLDRLTKQTGPKILKSLEAKVLAIRADKFLQDAAFSLETQRLDRIRKNIRNCTVKAPRDGIVVYVNDANRWGQVTAPIDQGVTVRQGQPIINLPDPLHMRVKARINESKVNLVHTGQAALVVVDAFPERPLRGRVAEITAINVPLNASDVRVYYANVDIEKGFDDLRPGLTAEVTIMIDRQPNATRVPLEAVRWAGGRPYVALYDRSLEQAGKQSWRWRPVQLGVSDTRFAEVTGGLEAGDRIVAHPRSLPEPAPSPVASSLGSLARLVQ
jgi:multidrug efflux pump subunit AcrA (membrane-fusion protein)